jgi:hypothetical protein
MEGACTVHTETLLDVFSGLEDPRCRRGVRHPFAGIVVLMLLGMLARIREMEVLVRWATVHWDQLQGPLGFDRDEPPCATTISRTLAQCRVATFQEALTTWLRVCLADSDTEGVLAVDGKTAKQGLDDNGRPLHMLNAFAIFAQRPLAELICKKNRDYLLQIEANQGDTLDALEHCFAQAAERVPAAETTEKKGRSRKPVVYGSI